MEDSGDGQLWQRRTTIAAKDNGTQDPAVDYDGEGQEWAAREGGDSKVAMMAVAVEDVGGGRLWRQWPTTAMADDDRGGQRRRWMMAARKIKRQTTRGKKESGRQTTMALA